MIEMKSTLANGDVSEEAGKSEEESAEIEVLNGFKSPEQKLRERSQGVDLPGDDTEIEVVERAE